MRIATYCAPTPWQPGCAVYRINLKYPCPDEMVPDKTPPIPLVLLPPRTMIDGAIATVSEQPPQR